MDPGEAKSLSTQLKETMHLKGFKMEKPRRGRRLERKHTFLKRHETLVRALLCATVRYCALYALVLVNFRLSRRLRGCDEERARIIWRSILVVCMKCCN
jgi:hypothetical protein